MSWDTDGFVFERMIIVKTPTAPSVFLDLRNEVDLSLNYGKVAIKIHRRSIVH